MEIILTILVKLGLGKVLDWLGLRREIRAAEGRGQVEGRAGVHDEAYVEKIKEIEESPHVTTAKEANAREEMRRKQGME